MYHIVLPSIHRNSSIVCLQRMRWFCLPESAITYKHSSTALCSIILNFIEWLATSQSLADTTTMYMYITQPIFKANSFHVTGRNPSSKWFWTVQDDCEYCNFRKCILYSLIPRSTRVRVPLAEVLTLIIGECREYHRWMSIDLDTILYTGVFGPRIQSDTEQCKNSLK